MSVNQRFKIWQIDMMTAFWYEFLDEVMYVEQPHPLKFYAELVYRLRKALYWLNQLSQFWYHTIVDFLKKIDLERLDLYHNICVSQDYQLFLALSVDNLFVFAFDKSCFTDIQDQLDTRFKMTNLREISYYLGMKVDVETGKISLQQTTYLKQILECFQIIDSKHSSISINFFSCQILSFLAIIKLIKLQSRSISE